MSLLDILAPGLGQIVNVVGTVVDRLIPDTNAAQKVKDEIAVQLADAQAKGQLAQIEVNKAEAVSGNMFVAGWRPAIGWVCAGALGYQYLFTPLMWWAATSFHLALTAPPKLDDVLWQLMFGMLGMGGLRTYEKTKGIADKH